ncbi:hypothetical protein ACHQM5_002952 [Ranunculus cassubicifolius]
MRILLALRIMREILIVILIIVLVGGNAAATTVSYDHRAIVINGERRVLLSGSVHYPRTTPDMWPKIIRKSKEGGIDVIETYVFWNNHEPVKGQYYFEERFDLVKFVKTVQEAGLFVHLRIGPYACAEWNYGGFPLWLHFIPGIQFRTTNTPFKVENEYGNVEWAYGVGGELYIKWAAETAINLNTSVPWVMCAQSDAPDPIINTCNGFYCDEFTPNSPSKPKMWTENYVGWFSAFGYPYPFRPVEDLAFAVARFFEKGGTFQNYYMAHIYYKSSKKCAAFLANVDKVLDANVTFNGKIYHLPAWSVSILPDCKDVVYNTAKITSQKSLGHRSTAYVLPTVLPWSWYKEKPGIQEEYSFISSTLLEQINTTKDISDFLWYTTSINIDEKLKPGEMKEVLLSIESLGHAALIYINKEVVGFGYGNHDDASFNFSKLIKLNQGKNSLALLSMLIGVQNYGPWFDISPAGIFSVFVGDLNRKEDLSSNEWTYQVGLEGEYLGLDKLSHANSSLWTSGTDLPLNQTLIWYKTSFIAPEGKGPLALNLSSMGKGQAWVNGQGIGRYWSSYLAPTTGCTDPCDYRGTYDAQKCQRNCGQPAQILYHVPRSWVQPGENLLVLHEELGGDPSKISVSTRTDEQICSHVSGSINSQVELRCEKGWRISSISFASFGTPTGLCGILGHGLCHAHNTLGIVEKECVGKEWCSIPVSADILGDPCPGVLKSLAVEALCTA